MRLDLASTCYEIRAAVMLGRGEGAMTSPEPKGRLPFPSTMSLFDKKHLVCAPENLSYRFQVRFELPGMIDVG